MIKTHLISVLLVLAIYLVLPKTYMSVTNPAAVWQKYFELLKARATPAGVVMGK